MLPRVYRRAMAVDPSRAVAHELPGALETLAAHPGPVKPAEVALESGVAELALLGAIRVLQPFGVLTEDRDGNVELVSDAARDFVLSIAALLRQGVAVVDDWHRLGAECERTDEVLGRGVRFLCAIEKRRAEDENALPLRRMEIAKALITARTVSDESAYLLILNEKSGAFQFIGGTLRPGENPELAMHRELREEMPHANLGKDGSYFLREVRSEPATVRFVSPTYGRLTEYQVNYFHAQFPEQPRISPNQRWISLRELISGETADGCSIVPSGRHLALSEKELSALPPSFAEKIELETRDQSPRAGQNETAGSSHPSIQSASGSAIALLIVAVAVLVAAARLAPDQFNAILLVTVSLVVILFAFVARAIGLINAGEMVALFHLGKRR